MRFLKFPVLAGLVFTVAALLAPHAALAGDSIKMGTFTCPGVSFDCKTLAEQKKEIIVASNECIAKKFGISEPIMGAYNTRGEFENCATSSRRAQQQNGTEVWAACCLKKISTGAGQCALRCTRYMLATN